MRGRLLCGLLALAVASTSLGAFLNDDVDQATALWNLEAGHLTARERPEHLRLVSDDLPDAPRTGGDVLFASLPQNLVAVAVGWVVRGVDLLVPIQAVAGVGLVLLVAGALPWPALRRVAGTGRLEPTQRLSLAVRVLGLAGLALFATWPRGPWPDMELWWPYVSLKLTNLGLYAGTLWLGWDLLARRVAPASRTVAFTLLAVGSLTFWAGGMKYHALNALLVTAALWLVDQGPTKRRAMLLGLVGGLAAWANLGAGLATLAAIGTLTLVAAGWRAKTLRVAVGVLAGLVPMFVENQLLHGNPLLNHYLDPPPGAWIHLPAAGLGKLGLLFVTPGERVVGALHWDGIVQSAQRLLGTFTTGAWVEGPASGILAIAPLAALAVRPRPWTPTRVLAWSLVGAQAVLWTNAGAFQGYGYDVRYWTLCAPAFAVLAWDAWPASGDPRGQVRGFVATVAGSLALAALFASGEATAFAWRMQVLVVLTGLAVALQAWAGLLLLRRPALGMALGALAAVPLLWLLLHTWGLPERVYSFEGSPGTRMLVPGMEPVVDTFREWFMPDAVVPTIGVREGSDPAA